MPDRGQFVLSHEPPSLVISKCKIIFRTLVLNVTEPLRRPVVPRDGRQDSLAHTLTCKG